MLLKTAYLPNVMYPVITKDRGGTFPQRTLGGDETASFSRNWLRRNDNSTVKRLQNSYLAKKRKFKKWHTVQNAKHFNNRSSGEIHFSTKKTKLKQNTLLLGCRKDVI